MYAYSQGIKSSHVLPGRVTVTANSNGANSTAFVNKNEFSSPITAASNFIYNIWRQTFAAIDFSFRLVSVNTLDSLSALIFSAGFG